MVVAASAFVLAVGVTVGAAFLGWWAVGGGLVGVLPALLLGGFAGFVAFGMGVPLALTWTDAGSIRQAKKALREARNEGRPLATAGARLRLGLVRWQRRQHNR